jgi:hypothetical protein
MKINPQNQKTIILIASPNPCLQTSENSLTNNFSSLLICKGCAKTIPKPLTDFLTSRYEKQALAKQRQKHYNIVVI